MNFLAVNSILCWTPRTLLSQREGWFQPVSAFLIIKMKESSSYMCNNLSGIAGRTCIQYPTKHHYSSRLDERQLLHLYHLVVLISCLLKGIVACHEVRSRQPEAG